jgi:ligand-binding sensor domain-containing protein
MKNCIVLIVLVIAGVMSQASYAQKGTWSYSHEGTQFYSITEDQDGNLWFACSQNKAKNPLLLKYDGTNWTIIDNVPLNQLFVIKADQQNNIWVAPGLSLKATKILARYDGKKWSAWDIEKEFAITRIYSIDEDKNGNLCFGGDKGFVVMDGNRLKLISTIGNRNQIPLIPHMLQDEEGNTWFSGTRLEKSNGQSKEFFKLQRITSLVSDKNGKIYVSRLGGKVGFYNGSTFTFTRVTGVNFNASTFALAFYIGILPAFAAGWLHNPEHDYTTLFIDSRNNLWLGARGSAGGLNKNEGGKWKRLNKQIKNPKNISGIFEDKQANIWVVTKKKSISCFDGSKWANYTDLNGMKKSKLDKFGVNPISSFFVDSSGNVWFATMNGIIRFTPKPDLSED